MTTYPQYIDISHHNANRTAEQWQRYKEWSASVDGVSRVSLKLTEGTAFVDPSNHYAMALEAGINIILPYHYARPDQNPGYDGAQREVNFYRQTLAGRFRESDMIMLDYEGSPGVPSSQYPPDWAHDWLHIASGNQGIPASRAWLYSYDNFIRTNLQYGPLADFPLIYARYVSAPLTLPPCPPPWSVYAAWQWTSSATNVPGFDGAEPIDVNIWTSVPPPAPGPDLAKIKSDLLIAQAAIADALKELG